MGEKIKLGAADGHEFDAYCTAPEGKARGGIVVVQEIFGVNHHIREVCDGYAQAGYAACAPAVFDRAERGVELGYKMPEDFERGRALLGKIGFDAMLKDVEAAVARLARDRLKVGVVGFCMGGTVAWLAGTRLDGVAAAVGYYGGRIADHAGETPRCPAMLHFGETDHAIPADHWARIQKAHPDLPLHVYKGAGHGFNTTDRESFDVEAAKLAHHRTLTLFGRHLGG